MSAIDSTSAISWKAIKGFDYEVSEYGKVRRSTAFKNYPVGFELTAKPNIDGYNVVRLGKNGRLHDFRVARLVAIAFLGDPPSKNHQVAHNNGDKTQDHVSNLRWATVSENLKDKAGHGTASNHKGSKHGSAVLNEMTVSIIRKECLSGQMKPSEAAVRFGVSRPTISDILHYRTWTHIS